MASLLNEAAHGVYPIMPTPFKDGGEIDWESVDRLADFYIQAGADGLTILGIMGEAPKLSSEESTMFVRHCVKRIAGRIPIIVGASNPGIRLLAEFSRYAMDQGAAGVMVAPVAGLATEEQVYAYFQAVVEALGDIPIVVQNYPQSNHVSMSVALLHSIFRAFPSLKMLKHEEMPGLRKLSRLRASDAEMGRRISILGGNGALHFTEELARGADGTMTGFAFPEMLIEVNRRYVAGNLTDAENLYDLYLPYLRYEQQFGVSLAIRKETLRRRGLLQSAITRSPGPSLDANDNQELTRILQRLHMSLDRGDATARTQASLVPTVHVSASN